MRWRAALRLAALAGLFLICLPPHLIERTLRRGGSRWPRRFLGAAAQIAGARVKIEGSAIGPRTLILANHTSWLDILILAGATGTAFVSKAEVAATPLIGWLSDQNHTLYIERSARGEAMRQVERIAMALAQPRPLAIFPEGTTGEGRELLPFRSTLLEAVAPAPPGVTVRPAAIDYGAALDDIAWHGGEAGLANVLKVLGRKGSFPVTVRLLLPLAESDDRKVLAKAAREAIAAALPSVSAATSV